MIYIKSPELHHLLGLESSYARLTDLFDGPVYRLQKTWQQEQGKSSKLAKAIQETDEKVGLILWWKKEHSSSHYPLMVACNLSPNWK